MYKHMGTHNSKDNEEGERHMVNKESKERQQQKQHKEPASRPINTNHPLKIKRGEETSHSEQQAIRQQKHKERELQFRADYMARQAKREARIAKILERRKSDYDKE